MKKLQTMAICAIATAATFAQGADGVQSAASDPAVQEMLAEPDGVCILRNENDGSLQILALGTADYEFGDARDIRNKTKVAELRAKASLSKYLKEVIQVEESAGDAEVTLARTLLTEDKDGAVSKKSVSRETVESTKEILAVRSAAILSGVVTRKTVKKPTEGSKTSGEIQVTVGISTKTLAAAAEAHNRRTDSLNARRAVGETGSTAGKGAGKESKRSDSGAKGEADSANSNKPEVRINKTLF